MLDVISFINTVGWVFILGGSIGTVQNKWAGRTIAESATWGIKVGIVVVIVTGALSFFLNGLLR